MYISEGKMKLRNWLTMFCTVLLTFLVCGFADAFELNLNVHTGDKYNVHIVNNIETNMSVNNREVQLKQVVDMNYSLDVQDIDKDKNATIYYRYDSIKVSSEAAGQRMEYDSSQNNPQTPLSAIYSSMIGKGFTVKLDKKGHLLEINGANEILNGMADSMPGNEEQKKAFRKIVVQSFGDDAIKTMLKSSMGYYPEKSIQIGDSWESTYEIKAVYPMTMTSKWKLLGEKNGLLSADLQARITTTPDSQGVEFMGVKSNINLSGDCVGSFNINKSNGLIQNGTMVENISGEIEISNPAKSEEVKLPIKIVAKIICETTKQ